MSSSQRLPRALADVLEGAGRRGETVRETAERRVTSVYTVKAQRRAILRRLGARNITEAASIAERERLF